MASNALFCKVDPFYNQKTACRRLNQSLLTASKFRPLPSSKDLTYVDRKGQVFWRMQTLNWHTLWCPFNDINDVFRFGLRTDNSITCRKILSEALLFWDRMVWCLLVRIQNFSMKAMLFLSMFWCLRPLNLMSHNFFSPYHLFCAHLTSELGGALWIKSGYKALSFSCFNEHCRSDN